MFTERQIKAMTWKGGNRNTPDWRGSEGEPRGFAIRVRPDDVKVFYVRINRKYRKIGDYGAWTLEAARKKARELNYLVDIGQDPFAKKKTETAKTVSEFALDYFKIAAHLKSIEPLKKRVNRTVVKWWGDLPLKDLTRDMVREKFNELKAKTPVEANRFLAAVSAMWNAAIDEGVLPDSAPNPVTRIKGRYKEAPRQRIVQEHEMPHLLRAIEAEKSPAIRAIFWLYLLVGLRRGNVLGLKWEYIDFRTGELHFPASEMKNGMRFDTVMPDKIVALLKEIPQTLHNPYVFAGEKAGSQLEGIRKPWDRIRARAEAALKDAEKELPEAERHSVNMMDITIHDLRRTFGSWARKAGVAVESIGDAMAHKPKTITDRVYAIGDLSERRAALKKLEDYLLKFLPATTSQSTALA